jgi:hypothetical protein
MSLTQAIDDLIASIKAVSPDAEIRVLRHSDEEASIRAYAPAEHGAAIKEATREKTIKLSLDEGIEVQVIFYDIATDLPPKEAEELPAEE